MTNESKKTMTTKLNDFISGYNGAYCQSLFDPTQTHAIFGLPKTSKEQMKQSLKEIGAKKFRMVQPYAKDFIIICFDASNIK